MTAMESVAYGPQLPSVHDVRDAQVAADDANLAGCSDAVYERLVLQKLQTAVAYREAACRADAYVTEIRCPEPDSGIQRLFSPMKEAEAEVEDWYCADYDAEAAEYDVEPEAEL
jgi:hypothetical protein